jgi:hypothetical protein
MFDQLSAAILASLIKGFPRTTRTTRTTRTKQNVDPAVHFVYSRVKTQSTAVTILRSRLENYLRCNVMFLLNLFSDELNFRPIIGILAQELSSSLQNAFQGQNFTSYIGAAYVKYIESAGARVVPVLINQVNVVVK